MQVLVRWRALLAALCVLAVTLPARAAEAPVILVLGDSLSAAYGLDAAQGWVSLLQQRIAERGFPHRVVNASVSGDTTAGGLSRLPAAIDRNRPALVLLELGGNDGLRGQPVAQLRANLQRMVELSRAAGAVPVLFEMQIPSNYGATYTRGFAQSFSDLAQQNNVPLVPFFMSSFAGDPDAFQADGIHPAADAQDEMLEVVWGVVEPLLKP